MKGRYILTITAKRKKARRHISRRGDSIADLREFGRGLAKRYIVEIYDSRWNLMESVKEAEA